ncbi:hypothetical protein BT96DRAFT_919341 [Gymnopus androsaceus JB14]|uniref:HNH nuclease domain-containing protein n=1 Tax=Gymnopus androsaceus JB14 TaxID=1447944 RepID=A0A6A4HTQ4_9AGAR|nr:hypothetical protein BT96DRAFT_919341 [Gymnopus androsaceus JB14]
MALAPFNLPLTNGAPTGYGWANRTESEISSITAFETGIDERDRFHGVKRCVVCGESIPETLQHCYSIPRKEERTWDDLKERDWIPAQAKRHPAHEPRNGLLMCVNHHKSFDAYAFFLRYLPESGKFVLVNYSDHHSLVPFHGKAIALDSGHRYSPFPSVFIIHEMRVRGRYPFAPISPPIPSDPTFQDWITTCEVFDPTTKSFIRPEPPRNNNSSNRSRDNNNNDTTALQPMTGVSQSHSLVLNDDAIREIVQATRQMDSWKACQIEGTDWSGTGEENIRKYMHLSDR